MGAIYTGQEWFDSLVPDGFPNPSSTLISGPGGTGKPLIGNVITAAWLRQGGSVVFMSLQYPDHKFIAAGLQRINNLSLDNYQKQTFFIELDATLEGVSRQQGNHIKANLVKPEIWDQSLKTAFEAIPEESPGILVFASALNLLLFSPTYGKAILERMKAAARGEARHTYLLSVSTTAHAEEIKELEEVSQNLILTRNTTSPFRLYMQIERIKKARFVSEEIEVPISTDALLGVKEIADHSRKRVIPLVSQL